MGVKDKIEEGREVWKGVKDARKLVRRLGRRQIGWPRKKKRVEAGRLGRQ